MDIKKVDDWPRYFDAIILDVWGIVSDGFSLLDSSSAFLEKVQNLHLKTVLISNTPFLNQQLEERLEKMGLSFCEEEIVTAGDVVRDLCASNQLKLGSHYFYVGPTETHNLLEGLNYTETLDISQAKFLLVTGYPENSLLDLIHRALNLHLPLLCSNPDKFITLKDGTLVFCAGKIAEQYELLGGKVIYVGKPYPEIYKYTLKMLPKIIPERILCIGDSLETDIAGAKRMNFKSLLISTESLTQENLIFPDWQISSLNEVYNV